LKYLFIGNNKLPYSTFGQGSKSLICFHGYDLNKEIFKNLIHQFGEDYTIFSFDLPFHGEAEWEYIDIPIAKNDLSEAVNIFLNKENIHEFSVLGFSMGGRYALALLEHFNTRVKQLFLLAPDGVKTSFWYNMGTYSGVLRTVFKKIILSPKWFIKSAIMLQKVNLVDAGVVKFALYELNLEQKRRKLYYTWIVMRDLKFNIRKISQILNNKEISIIVITGKFDKIVKSESMKKLLNAVNNSQHQIIPTGHTDLVSYIIENHTLKPYIK
jgi:pimeloyl-ACP methyl ester carboxylesterase